MLAIHNLYNKFALLIRAALDCTDENFFERYSALGQERLMSINKDVESSFSTLFYDGNIVQMSDSLCTEKFLESLSAVSVDIKGEYEKQVLVRLLTILDISMSKCIENYSTEGIIKGLNSNADQIRLQLLPRAKCFWEHRNRGSNHSNDLMNYLNFFIFIDMKKTDGYKILNYFLPYDTFTAARKRKTLRTGMCPMSNQGKLKWTEEIREGSGYFSITDIDNSAVIETNLLKLNEELKSHHIDIAIMPEMLGNYQMKKNYMEILSSFPEDNIENCPLIVFPSIWSEHHNTSTVLNGQGDIVIQQEKQHPFLYQSNQKEKYLEDIRPEKEICLLHCEGIGRIAILICKDALMTQYIQMVLNILKVTLLIIPSFSTGNFDFQEIVQCCRPADCCACWINTCSVTNLHGADITKLDTIGFFLRCGKKSAMPNDLFLCRREDQCCCKEEKRDCGRCIFAFDLPFG